MENAAIDHISLLMAPAGSAVCVVTKVVGVALLVHAVAKGRFLFSRFLSRRQILSGYTRNNRKLSGLRFMKCLLAVKEQIFCMHCICIWNHWDWCKPAWGRPRARDLVLGHLCAVAGKSV